MIFEQTLGSTLFLQNGGKKHPFFTLLFIWTLIKIADAHEIANDNIQYLYRKKMDRKHNH